MDRNYIFNAPQFQDFAALGENGGGYDDSDADKYFETHREEDDVFIPAETLKPTIQLQNEPNNNTPGTEITETNSQADDIKDVSVECYSTPNGKQSSVGGVGGTLFRERNSNSSDTTTPGGKFVTSSSSLTPSFHTPIGEENYKENSSPHHSFLSTAEKALVASSRHTTASVADGNVSQDFLREPFMAQFGKLNMVDVDDVDHIHSDHSEYSPINEKFKTNNQNEEKLQFCN